MPKQPGSTAGAGHGGGPSRGAPRRGALAAAAALALAVLLGGCGAIGDWAFPPDPASGTPSPTPAGAPPEGVSAACRAAVAQATPSPDAAVAALPGNWPAPPAGSELCLVSVEPGGAPVATLVHATAASPEEVLAHYEAALREGYSTERVLALGGGQSLEGTGNGVTYAVTPAAGSFTIVVRADADA